MSLQTDDYNEQEIGIVEDCIAQQTHDFSIYYKNHQNSLPYRQRVNQFKMPIHNGQRKLFLSSLLFLTKYSKMSELVVYAGAAPGTNVIILAKLYPNVKFHLYDPRPFDEGLKNCENVVMFQTYFTNDTAKSYNGKNILLWSDIRTGTVEDDDFEDQVIENNNMQKKWHDLSDPVFGMYKFRLPYKSSKLSKYMGGEIWMQIWAPPTSTETRLVVPRGYKAIKYDNTDYENRMYYFNVIDRQWKTFESYNDVKLMNVGCCCYDCTGEKTIIARYLKSIGKYSPDSVQKISKCLSKYLNTIKHLHHGYIDKPIWEKYTIIVARFKQAVQREKDRKLKIRKIHYDANATKLIKDI